MTNIQEREIKAEKYLLKKKLQKIEEDFEFCYLLFWTIILVAIVSYFCFGPF